VGLAPADLDSQRLYRVQVDAPRQRGSLRLVLRLWTPQRFELAASDALGRTLGRLEVAAGEGRWSGAERGERCRLDPDVPFHWPALGARLRPRELPELLLGRMPAELDAPPPDGVGVVELRDRQGVTWSLERDERGPVRWRRSGALPDAETLEWTRDGAGGRLTLAGAAVEVRWKEVARERLRTAPPPIEPELSALPPCAADDGLDLS
jgi:hypothetical protein